MAARRELRWLVVLAAAVMVLLWVEEPKGGYFRLEMPAVAGGFETVTKDWSATDRETAFFGLGLDGLFIIVYCRLLSLALLHLLNLVPIDASRSALLRLSPGWIWVVGALDALEDCGILLLLRRGSNQTLEIATTGAAIAKFTGLAGAACLLVVAWLKARSPGNASG